MDIKAEIPKTEQQKLAAIVNALVRTTGKCAWDYALQQAKAVTKTALGLTPIAKRRVKKYYLEAEVNGRNVLLPVKPYWKDLSRSRGFAKSGWAKAMKALCVSGNMELHGKGKGYFYGHYKAVKEGQTGGTLEVGNRIPYIGDLDAIHHIGERSMKNVRIRGEYMLAKIKERAAAAWTRKALSGIK